MKFQPVNLLLKLEKEQVKINKRLNVLTEVQAILDQDSKTEARIEAQIQSNNSNNINTFNLDLLETNRIYHIDAIKKICVDYRLRFLDSRFFKPEIPYEAICEIKALEKTHNTTLEGFKIIAPAKLLKLENADDPILFAPIGNGYYYLIHKWGNDLSAFRKLKMMPFRTLENLILFAFFVSFLLTFVVPHGNISVNPSTFWILFLFMFKSVVGIAIFYGFAKGKNVSTANWDSKYYNG